MNGFSKIFSVALTASMVACGSSKDPSEPRPGGDFQTIVQNNVEYRAETLIMESFPVQVRANVQITNSSGSAVTITFPDGCLVLLRVYRDAERTSLAYDMERDFGCTQALVPVTIGAGESKTISAPTISAAKILGDSLPNGTYYFTALTRPEGQRVELRAGSAALAK